MEANLDRILLARKLLSISDESLIAKIARLLDQVEEKEIVAFSVQGVPLTIANYDAMLQKAEEDTRNGSVITTDELRERLHQWGASKK